VCEGERRGRRRRKVSKRWERKEGEGREQDGGGSGKKMEGEGGKGMEVGREK